MKKKLKIKVTKKIFETKSSSNWDLHLFKVRKEIKIIFTFNLKGGKSYDMHQKLNQKNNK